VSRLCPGHTSRFVRIRSAKLSCGSRSVCGHRARGKFMTMRSFALRPPRLARISHTKEAHRGPESAKVVLRERLLTGSRMNPDADRV